MKETAYDINADIVRILAVIFVIVIHVTDRFVSYPPIFNGFSWWVANVLNSFSRVAVPLFVLLSGYLILGKDNLHPPMVYFDKAQKVFKILLAWYAIYIGWRYLLFNNQVNSTQVIRFLVIGKIDHLYYLYIVIGLYLATPIIKRVWVNKNHANILTVALVIVGLLFNLFFYVLKLPPLLLNSVTMFIPYLGYYLLGGRLRFIKLNKPNIYLLLIIYILTVLLTSILNFMIMNSVRTGVESLWIWNNAHYITSPLGLPITVAAVSLFLITINLSIWLPQVKPAIRSIIPGLARSVMGIYLIHLLVIEFVDRVFNLGVDRLLSPLWFYLLLKIFMVCVASYILVALMRRHFSTGSIIKI